MKGDFVCEFYDGQGWHQLEHKVGTERARGVTWKRNYLDVPATGENNADFKLRFRVDYAQGHAGVDDVVVRGVALR